MNWVSDNLCTLGWKLRAALGCLWLEVTCRIGMSVVGIYVLHWYVCGRNLRAALGCLVGIYVLHWYVCGWNLRAVLGCVRLEVTCCNGM